MLVQLAEADLGKDALTSEEPCRQANDKAHHGQTAIPGLSKSREAKASLGVGHADMGGEGGKALVEA